MYASRKVMYVPADDLGMHLGSVVLAYLRQDFIV